VRFREGMETVGFHIQTLHGVAGAKPLKNFPAGIYGVRI